MARQLRSADTLLAPAVHAAINALQLNPEDSGAVQLAHRYAAAIDQADPEVAQEVLEKLGPKLLAVLESLGATPKARAALKGGGERTRAESRLAAIRAARPA